MAREQAGFHFPLWLSEHTPDLGATPHAARVGVSLGQNIYTPADTLLPDYEHMLNTLGVQRAALVQGSIYGTDNTVLLEALKAGRGRYRGVAVVAPDISANELRVLHDAGVRGVRMNIVDTLLKIALFGSAWVLYLLLSLSVLSVGVVGERDQRVGAGLQGGAEAVATGVHEAGAQIAGLGAGDGVDEDVEARAQRVLRLGHDAGDLPVVAHVALAHECRVDAPGDPRRLRRALGPAMDDAHAGTLLVERLGDAPCQGVPVGHAEDEKRATRELQEVAHVAAPPAGVFQATEKSTFRTRVPSACMT